MFGDIGWAELMIIGVVALIVIGPKDLPEMFRQLGRITAKLRGMAREFSRAMEQAAKESGMTEAANDLKAATSPAATGLDKVKAAADSFEKWDPLKASKPVMQPLTPPPMPSIPPKPAPAASADTTKAAPAAPAAPDMAPAPDAGAPKPARAPRRKKADLS